MESKTIALQEVDADPIPPVALSETPLSLARLSDRLLPALIEPAPDMSPHRHPSRALRKDGWTPERIRIFLTALAECGVVRDAARAAGMSAKSAYNLRNRTANQAFHLAWSAAEQLARRRLSSELMSRAIHGCVELIVRDGKVWAERHRFDNRLTMAVLDRLDRQAGALDKEGTVVRHVAQEFDQFVDIVCAGGRGAVEFIDARQQAASSDNRHRHSRLLERAENYRLRGDGLAGGTPAPDPGAAETAGRPADAEEREDRSPDEWRP